MEDNFDELFGYGGGGLHDTGGGNQFTDSGGGVSGGGDSRFGFSDWTWTGSGLLGNDSEGGINDHGLLGYNSGNVAVGYQNNNNTGFALSSGSGSFLGTSFNSHDDVKNYRMAMTDIEYSVDKDGTGLTIGDVKFENLGVNEIEAAMMDYSLRDKIAQAGITTQELAVELRNTDARSVTSAEGLREALMVVLAKRLGDGSLDEATASNTLESVTGVKDSVKSSSEKDKDKDDSTKTATLHMDYAAAESASIDEVQQKTSDVQEDSTVPLATRAVVGILQHKHKEQVVKSTQVEHEVKTDPSYMYKSSDHAVYDRYHKVSKSFDKTEDVKQKLQSSDDHDPSLSQMDYSKSTDQKSHNSKKPEQSKKSAQLKQNSGNTNSRFGFKNWNFTGGGYLGEDGEGGVNDSEIIGHKNGSVFLGYLNTSKASLAMSSKSNSLNTSFNSHDDVDNYRLQATDIEYSVDKDGTGLTLGDVKFDNIPVGEIEQAFLDEDFRVAISKSNITSQELALALRDVDARSIVSAEMLQSVINGVIDNKTGNNKDNKQEVKTPVKEIQNSKDKKVNQEEIKKEYKKNQEALLAENNSIPIPKSDTNNKYIYSKSDSGLYSKYGKVSTEFDKDKDIKSNKLQSVKHKLKDDVKMSIDYGESKSSSIKQNTASTEFDEMKKSASTPKKTNRDKVLKKDQVRTDKDLKSPDSKDNEQYKDSDEYKEKYENHENEIEVQEVVHKLDKKAQTEPEVEPVEKMPKFKEGVSDIHDSDEKLATPDEDHDKAEPDPIEEKHSDPEEK